MVSSANQSSRSISPSSPQPGHHLLDLVGDGGGVAPHELVAQRLVVQHLAAALRRGVEHHALAEDRRHERVGLGLVELLLGRPEEELVGVRPGQQHDVAAGQVELADVAALGPHPAHAARSGRGAARPGGRSRPRRPRPAAAPAGSSPCVTAAPSDFAAGQTGASAGPPPRVRWVPRGVGHDRGRWPAATPSGRRKCECRARPQRAHSSSTSPVTSGSQSMPMPVRVGPGRTIDGPHPGALELHLQRADEALEPPLGRHVGRHRAAGVRARRRTSRRPGRRAGARPCRHRRPRTSRCAPPTLTRSTCRRSPPGPVSSAGPA